MSKKDQLIKYIKEQTSIDLTNLVVNENFKPRKFLCVYVNEIKDRRTYNALVLLSHRYKKDIFMVHDNGGMGIALEYLKKKSA